MDKDCPSCRALEITEWIDRANDDQDTARLARARHMTYLRSQGLGNADIAAIYGVSRVRVVQILRALELLERAPFAIAAEYHN